MIKIIRNKRKAVIILHEIYGVNRFIEDVCAEYHMLDLMYSARRCLDKNALHILRLPRLIITL
jgi:hypothetical protein